MIESLIYSVNPFATIQPTEAQSCKKSLDDIHLEVGSSNICVDSIRNVLSIPMKLMLWNSSMNSGNVSADTLEKIKEYLHENNLHDVHVSVNQYKPQDVWKRTFTNPKTSVLSKMTFGVTAVLFETLLFPKLTGFPGDHYNPYSNTVHLFSNDTAIALHECGHAKDFNSRNNPTLYFSLSKLPYVGSLATLYHEYLASSNTINYLREKKSNELLSHSFKVLVPAYAMYCAEAILPSIMKMPLETPTTYRLDQLKELLEVQAACQNYLLGFGFILLVGHLAGRILAANVQNSTINDDSELHSVRVDSAKVRMVPAKLPTAAAEDL